MAKAIDGIVSLLEDFSGTQFAQNSTAVGEKILRLKILADRRRDHGVKTVEERRDELQNLITTNQPPITPSPDKTYQDDIRANQNVVGIKAPQKSVIKYPVTLINLDSNDYNIPGYDKLQLSYVPTELNYNAESNFVGIASIGRNNPHYQYAGAEDTLEFVIDWFSNKDDRTDVINNCRWVEALSKNNGYSNRPPRVKIQWGPMDKLFKDHIFIVTSAPYRLNNWQGSGRDKDGNIVSTGLLPQQAYQTVTLKRISDINLSTKKILNNR